MGRTATSRPDLRATLEYVLERCSSFCLDTEVERRHVAHELERALLGRRDAELVRATFAAAPTGCGKLIVTRGLGGRREAEVLNAAARLAGLETEE